MDRRAKRAIPSRGSGRGSRHGAAIRFGLACCLLLAVACGAPSVGTLTDDDERAILQLALERAIGEGRLPDLALLLEQSPVVLWEDPHWQDLDLSALPPYDILSADAVAARAVEQGAFVYLNLNCCRIQDDGRTVQVAVRTSWASPPDDRTLKMSGGALKLAMHRVAGGWAIQQEWVLIH